MLVRVTSYYSPRIEFEFIVATVEIFSRPYNTASGRLRRVIFLSKKGEKKNPSHFFFFPQYCVDWFVWKIIGLSILFRFSTPPLQLQLQPEEEKNYCNPNLRVLLILPKKIRREQKVWRVIPKTIRYVRPTALISSVCRRMDSRVSLKSCNKGERLTE
jgi:hypothetical protein